MTALFNTRFLTFFFSLLVASLLSACVSPFAKEDIDHNSARSERTGGQPLAARAAAPGTMAVMGYADLQDTEIPWDGGKIEGMLVGSLGGCFLGMQVAFYNPVACIPGAAVGAVSGLVEGADSEEIAEGRAAVLDAIAESDFNENLLSGIRAEAATQEGVQLVSPESHEGLFSHGVQGEWLTENCKALSERGIDSLLLLDETTLGLLGGEANDGEIGIHLVVVTRARLFDTQSGALLQGLEFFLPGDEYGDRHDWVEWDAQMLKEQLTLILEYAPLFIVDEMLGPAPPILRDWQSLKPDSSVRFSWQSPEGDPFYSSDKSVTYEVIVFTPQQVPAEHPCGRSCLLEKAAEWDYRRDGIVGRELVVEPAWNMSKRHFWSVRAGHVEGEQVRYTRWAKPRRIWR